MHFIAVNKLNSFSFISKNTIKHKKFNHTIAVYLIKSMDIITIKL